MRIIRIYLMDYTYNLLYVYYMRNIWVLYEYILHYRWSTYNDMRIIRIFLCIIRIIYYMCIICVIYEYYMNAFYITGDPHIMIWGLYVYFLCIIRIVYYMCNIWVLCACILHDEWYRIIRLYVNIWILLYTCILRLYNNKLYILFIL
jgi:hypothetical protein